MARVALPADGPGPLTCGPLLLARIREQPVGPGWTRALDTALAGDHRDTGLARLAALLSPLGVQHVLLEQGLYEEAAAALADQPGEEAAALLAEVLTRQGAELHRHREWTAALDCFTRAAAAGAALDGLHEEIADSALHGVRVLLAQDSEDHAGAVALLERALALVPGHGAVRENLGASYLQLGRQVNNEERDYARATRLVRLALEFAPDDQLARRTAGTVLVNHAGELMERGSEADLEQAEALLREAAAASDADEVRSVLAGVLYRKSRRLAVARDRTAALAAAGQAVLADPEKDHQGVAAVRAEARRMVGVMLHNHALGDEFKQRPADRASLLEEARWYEDDDQTREALAWTLRNHGVDRANAGDFPRAVRLLKQSLEVQDLPDTRAQLALCYRIQAVGLANRRDLYGARRAVGEGLEFDPYDHQLLALKAQLARMR
jgi:tetratricopeptide (TPR) repeat protein